MQEELNVPKTFQEILKDAQKAMRAADLLSIARAHITTYQTGVRGGNGNTGKIRAYGVKLNIPDLPLQFQANLIAQELNKKVRELALTLCEMGQEIQKRAFEVKHGELKQDDTETDNRPGRATAL